MTHLNKIITMFCILLFGSVLGMAIMPASASYVGGGASGGTFAVTATSGVAVQGTTYFVDTTSAAVTMTLPSSAVGGTVKFVDYESKWGTNNLTVSQVAPTKINASTSTLAVSGTAATVTCTYVDNTVGYRCY